MSGLEIAELELQAPRGSLPELARFYGGTLGLPAEGGGVGGLDVRVGGARLRFAEAPDAEAPFYHLALLVPGDRFAAARAWLDGQVALLPGARGNAVFDFPAWDAEACYCHDPAGSILELIAHRGIAEGGRGGLFSGRELAGISEIGLVCEDRVALAGRLARELGVEVWDGDPAGSLAFAGRRAHTLILAPPGRGWLPTGRPAMPSLVRATLAGARPGRVAFAGHVVEAR
jgi:hypothetical protein